MFKVTKLDILQRSTSTAVFDRGVSYYQQGKVHSIRFNETSNMIRGVVEGTRMYSVEVIFGSTGQVSSAHCSCGSYGEYWGDCKHIVAFLLAVIGQSSFSSQQGQDNAVSGNSVFDYFQRTSNNLKKPVQLELIYEYTPDVRNREGCQSYASLRVGINKLYVIKSIRKFFEQLDANEDIEFGKAFTFSSDWHTFMAEDIPILDFFREAYEIQKRFDNQSYGNSSVLFRDKRLCVVPALAKRLFYILEQRSFRGVIMGEMVEDMRILEQNVPIEFTLASNQQDLILSVQSVQPLDILTPEGEYILAGKRIYKPTVDQRQNLKPFIPLLSGRKMKNIHIQSKEKEHFISEVLPYIQKAGRVNIEESVQALMIQEKLETKISLDQQGDTIRATTQFQYGPYVINPFEPGNASASGDQRILIRQAEQERTILNILDRFGFKVQIGCAYLEDEESIFEFIYEGIPLLQQMASIYYSDDFKKLKIQEPHSYSGGIRYNTQLDFLEFSFQVEGLDGNELYHALQALREKKKYFRLKEGSFLPLDHKELSSLAEITDYLDLKEEDFERKLIEIPKYRSLYLDRQVKEAGFIHIKRNQAFKEMIQSILEPGDLDFELPETLEEILREYQKIGFQWLKTLSIYHLGGILADDMGLGKTVQMLSLILSDKKEKGDKPSLIIAPTSLVYNWLAEVVKFAPVLRTIVISGNKEKRSEKLENLESFDLIITSYPLIRRDIEMYQMISFRYCILDEAQHIKNPYSQSAKTVKEIKAERRFAMTGTPMENSLSELWSIFDFVMPGYLFSHQKFLNRYENPIMRQKDETAMNELSKSIRPFILRRLKKDVLRELPDKIEHKMVVELTAEQKQIYLTYLERIKGEIAQEIEEKGFERSRIKILSGLTRLRQICCHPGVFLEDFQGESGKMQLLEEIISESVEGGHRILLFSQFTSMLAIIRNRLDQMKIEYLYLDGSTKTEDRGSLVQQFNDGKGEVFLISLKAGGTGLNLTGADTVIHFDPWWNPAVEDQASDRAHRIGQLQSVHVMKLITQGTIEEKIFELQQRKRQLVDAVIQPGETFLTKMTHEEITALFDE